MATMIVDPEVEQQIVDRLTSGDRRGAAESALKGYGKQVLTFLKVQIRDPSMADDLFQAFCETTWRDIGGFRAEGTFCGWARTVATRIMTHSIKARRSSKEYPVGMADELPPLASQSVGVENVEPTHPYARAAVGSRISAMVSNLADGDRNLLMLRMVEGCSWAEIAQRMHPDRPHSQRQLQTLSATLRQRFARLLAVIRQKWSEDAHGRIAGLLSTMPALERRLLQLTLKEGLPWDAVLRVIQAEDPKQNSKELRERLRSALGQFEQLWREQGLLTRELVDAGLLTSSALASGGPAKDRRAK